MRELVKNGLRVTIGMWLVCTLGCVIRFLCVTAVPVKVAMVITTDHSSLELPTEATNAPHDASENTIGYVRGMQYALASEYVLRHTYNL